MAGTFDRDTIVRRLRADRDAGRAIYDALCGSGITAKMAARGGASMVTTHALAYFRMQGLSSMAGYLPICDANALTLELGERALVNVVRDCPLVAGLLCVDPTRDMARFLEVAAAGYHGVMNCPTVALIDGKFRSDLEETGMSFAREVDVLGQASRMGLFTKAFCTSPTRRWPWPRPASTTSSCISATARAARSARRPCLRTTPRWRGQPRSWTRWRRNSRTGS